MGFDPAFVLMKDRTDRQISLQGPEGFFDRDQLYVVLPEQSRIIISQIGSQQITSFPPTDPAQFLPVDLS